VRPTRGLWLPPHGELVGLKFLATKKPALTLLGTGNKKARRSGLSVTREGLGSGLICAVKRVQVFLAARHYSVPVNQRVITLQYIEQRSSSEMVISSAIPQDAVVKKLDSEVHCFPLTLLGGAFAPPVDYADKLAKSTPIACSAAPMCVNASASRG